MEHLLSRLAEDNSPVVRRIVKLIHDSFLPLDQPRNVKVTRCVVLQQSNVAAARRFFLHAGKQMNLTDISECIWYGQHKSEVGVNIAFASRIPSAIWVCICNL